MQARLLAIYATYAEHILNLVPLEIEDEYLKVIIHLVGGSNLRVTEEWETGTLVSYSYYWLTADNRLKIGWDNAPHHAELVNFPHHKHVGDQTDRRSSDETSLAAVMQAIIQQISPLGA